MVIGRKPDDKLKQDPRLIRDRLRRAHARGDEKTIATELVNYTRSEAQFKPVHKWDMVELAMGMPRSPDGKFRGRPPAWLDDTVKREIKRQLHSRTYGKLVSNVDLAIKVLVKLMLSEEVDDKGKPVVDARTKLAASQFIIEHVVGKPTAVLQVDAVDTTRAAFASAIILDDGHVDSHLGEVLEGTIVEDEEEEEE